MVIQMYIIEPFIEIGWERRLRLLKRPWRIGKRIVILLQNSTYKPHSFDILIKIDPGSIFGTGGHATTIGCLIYLEGAIKGGERVLDLGTGTGILGIAACRLGAAKVLGIDIDYRASAVALTNAKRNGVDEKMKVICGDIECVRGTFDIIVANIRTEVLAGIMGKITPLLSPSGVLILSGILEGEAPGFTLLLKNHPLSILNIMAKEGWVTLLCSRGLDT